VAARNRGDAAIDVWGSGTASREFLYVEDCADGILRAAAQYDAPDPVNLGNGQEITIKELVHEIMRLTGFRGEVRWQTTRPDGQPRRCLDTSRALTEFGFQATTSLAVGLHKTIDWFEGSIIAAQGAAHAS
jgi:nucleoside-diphosphate-sugar epimerase